MNLGVNIDHVATIRQLRFSKFPDILSAARVVFAAGADSIVVHLREDRRHIQDEDVFQLREKITGRLNLEMSINKEIVNIACSVKPDYATLVPEKRQELTTEGGLDVVKKKKEISSAVDKLRSKNILVSLFIDPQIPQIKAAKSTNCEFIEIHTGAYSDSRNKIEQIRNFKLIKDSVSFAKDLGFKVNAGHGLDYDNVRLIAGLKDIEELNIGYSIICRSIFVGLKEAVSQMKTIIG